jgi:hypothetical protein
VYVDLIEQNKMDENKYAKEERRLISEIEKLKTSKNEISELNNNLDKLLRVFLRLLLLLL